MTQIEKNTAGFTGHPWLSSFRSDPEQALDELLRGVADIAPYERAEASDVLVMFFGHPEEAQREKLDFALVNWIKTRYQDDLQIRREHGLNRYVAELIQALSAAQRLPLPHTIDYLRTHFGTIIRWLGPLYLAPARDPAGELWRLMALNQKDRRFLADWYDLCEMSGKNWPNHYLSLGLLGLRLLPDQQKKQSGRLNPELLIGLLKWAHTLRDIRPDKQAFIRQWRTIRVLYPRTPKYWLEQLTPLLKPYPHACFLPWLELTGLKLKHQKTSVKTNRPVLPSYERRGNLLQRLKTEAMDTVFPEIRKLLEDHQRYAEFSGDPEYFFKTACDFGNRLIRRKPAYIIEVARTVNQWAPYSPHTWTLWARALSVSGKTDLAETVYWEALRRFPQNDVCRNALAELLARTDREKEAEALYRETMAKFHQDDVCRNALAELLARANRKKEAEALYRETMAKFHQNVVCRNALAELLARTDREKEAEALYRETMAKFHQDDVCRNALAKLLARTDREKEAEALFRETMAKFPQDNVCRIALTFWFLRWDRLGEAMEMLAEIRRRFREDDYIRRLAEFIERKKGGEEISTAELDDMRPQSGRDMEEDDPFAWTEVAKPAADGAVSKKAYRSESDSSIATGEKVMAPEKPDLDSELTEDDDLYDRLKENRTVGWADFWYRNGDEAQRKTARENLQRLLSQNKSHVYAHLVGALNDEGFQKRLLDQIEAFPESFPLHFVAAKRSRKDDDWRQLTIKYPRYRHVAWLGRLTENACNGDQATAVDTLFKWSAPDYKGDNFNLYFKDKMRRALFAEAEEQPDNETILRNIATHRLEIETLINDTLKREVDAAYFRA